MRLTYLLIKRYLIALGVGAVVLTADLLTKRLAAVEFAGNPVEVIPGFFGFTYVENFGSAFGFFQDGGRVVAIAAMLVTVVVIGAIAIERQVFETVILGLVLGGAIGNLVDRFARGDGLLDGGVIDWIELWFIPTFNLADASVTVAVGLLLLRSWQTR
ncbi:MAG TPA: signal peptidase II [Acidimicrobiia bacterium]|nr:signal peptidase II [Acidimicrobiia bacterium]